MYTFAVLLFLFYFVFNRHKGKRLNFVKIITKYYMYPHVYILTSYVLGVYYYVHVFKLLKYLFTRCLCVLLFVKFIKPAFSQSVEFSLEHRITHSKCRCFCNIFVFVFLFFSNLKRWKNMTNSHCCDILQRNLPQCRK